MTAGYRAAEVTQGPAQSAIKLMRPITHQPLALLLLDLLQFEHCITTSLLAGTVAVASC
jgi:hypothetical protein